MFYTPNMFMWFSQGNYIQDDKGQIILKEKPVLSWEYNYIRYYNAEKVFGLTEGNDVPLTQEQCDELDSFIIEKRKQVGILKMCVDSQGNYLGLKNIEDPVVYSTVEMSPPNGDDWIWSFDSKQWMKPYYYDADGKITQKDSESKVGFTLIPPPLTIATVNFQPEQNLWTVDDTDQVWINLIRKKQLLDVLEKILTYMTFDEESLFDANVYLIDIIKYVLEKNNLINQQGKFNSITNSFIVAQESNDLNLIKENYASFLSLLNKHINEKSDSLQAQQVGTNLIIDKYV